MVVSRISIEPLEGTGQEDENALTKSEPMTSSPESCTLPILDSISNANAKSLKRLKRIQHPKEWADYPCLNDYCLSCEKRIAGDQTIGDMVKAVDVMDKSIGVVVF